ncbi:hypothetical protein MRX96_025624 [Rhipicephalus microplus]
MKGLVVFDIIIIILWQDPAISNGNILMQRIRGGLQGGGGPGERFLDSLRRRMNTRVGLSDPGFASRRLPGFFPFEGRGLEDSVLGPGNQPFRGPPVRVATSRPMINFGGYGGQRLPYANSRRHPFMRPPAGSRFVAESGGGKRGKSIWTCRKKKRASFRTFALPHFTELREHDSAEHLRSSTRVSEDGNAEMHGGKRSELGFHGGPIVRANGLDHREGDSKIFTKGHGHERSHRHASNDEEDYKNEVKHDKVGHKTESTSISTFQALSLARQSLNLLHDMLALLTSNHKA